MTYDVAVPGWGLLTPRIGWSYTSTVYNDALNSPEIRQPSYSLINASLAFVPTGRNLALTLGVRNLTHKHYIVSGNVNPSLGAASATYSRPRKGYV